MIITYMAIWKQYQKNVHTPKIQANTSTKHNIVRGKERNLPPMN